MVMNILVGWGVGSLYGVGDRAENGLLTIKTLYYEKDIVRSDCAGIAWICGL